MKKISVIIPVFNSEKFLSSLYSDLVNQTFTDFEVLLVDDGSTDNSLKVCQMLQKKKEIDLRIFSQKNQGPSAARNIGLDNAKGEYICFIDSDDRVSNDYLEILYNSLNESRSDLSICGIIEEKRNGKKELIVGKNSFTTNQNGALEYFLMHNEWIGPVNKLYSRKIIEEISLRFNQNIHAGEDILFVCQYLLHIQKVCYIAKPLYLYKYNGNSITKSMKTLKKVNTKDFDNIKSQKLLEQLLFQYTPNVKKQLYSRGVKTYLRLHLNLLIANAENKEFEKKAYKYIKSHIKYFIVNPYVSTKLKIVALIYIVNPKLCANLYYQIG